MEIILQCNALENKHIFSLNNITELPANVLYILPGRSFIQFALMFVILRVCK